MPELAWLQSITTRPGSPAAVSLAAVALTESASKFGPSVPPRRMTWQSSLPAVFTKTPRPMSSMPKKTCCGGSGFHAVDGDLDVAVGAVLEPDGHRQSRRQLAVHLGLGGPGADRAPRDGVGDVLRAGRLQELASDRQSDVDDVEQQLAGDAQAAGHVERAVHPGIVDQALPADRGARLLEVHPHHDLEPIAEFVGHLDQPAGVVQCGRWVVHGARPHHDQQAVVATGQDVGDLVAVAGHALGAPGAQGDLGEHSRAGWGSR